MQRESAETVVDRCLVFLEFQAVEQRWLQDNEAWDCLNGCRAFLRKKRLPPVDEPTLEYLRS